jgi:hypothetical protein
LAYGYGNELMPEKGKSLCTTMILAFDACTMFFINVVLVYFVKDIIFIYNVYHGLGWLGLVYLIFALPESP